MATAGARQFGVTPPISIAQPTQAERDASNNLTIELTRQKNYESASDTNKRTVVLQSLQAITEAFVKQVSEAQGLPAAAVKSAGGKIFTYGSYRLGVFGPGSDIDTLVVVPKHVSRDDYFKYFPDLLVKNAPPGAITELTPVEEAFVPIIKFEYSGISIDLIFSRLQQNQVPLDQSLLDDRVLQGLDDHELRSLNGTRVTDEILQLVPQPAVFKAALRGIKLWAQRRAIYANIMGFPGGVAWAMLVARICQLFPQAVSATIIQRFFRIMDKWQWPEPVLLKRVENNAAGLNCRVWNPKLYPSDSFHLMPIITPAYPSMCATHNVTRSTMEIIHRELKRAQNIAEEIMIGKAPWKDLFGKHTFFTQDYKYYLSVISSSTTKAAQLKWSGLVESKVRLLVANVEGHESIALARPFNKGFERTHRCKTDEEIEQVIKNGSHQYQVPLDSLGDKKVADGEGKSNDEPTVTMVYTNTHYIGLQLHEAFEGSIDFISAAAHLLILTGAKSLDLAWQVDDFKNKCMRWEKYDKELSALHVIQTRNYELPDDVFAEGEVKPIKPQKRKATNGTSKKRSATDETNSASSKRQRQQAAAA